MTTTNKLTPLQQAAVARVVTRFAQRYPTIAAGLEAMPDALAANKKLSKKAYLTEVAKKLGWGYPSLKNIMKSYEFNIWFAVHNPQKSIDEPSALC